MEDFEAQVAKESSAYRRQVAGMLAIGYGYIFGAIILTVALIGGGVYIATLGGAALMLMIKTLKFTWPLLIVVPLLLRSIFVRVPPPEGRYLHGDEKERVLKFVEPIRQAAGGPEIHEVILDDELNAAVVQLPRFGLFGPTKNYLILGVPLLTMMSREETEAVIAHEFGHLSHAHGRLTVWTYRLRETLHRAITSMQSKAGLSWDNWAFKFFDWYYPKFDAVSFALCRQQEYEADRVAAKVVGSKAAASALQRLAYDQPRYSSYWNGVWESTRMLKSNAQITPWSRLASGLTRFADVHASVSSLQHALQRPSDNYDTHPSLSERLAALGEAASETIPNCQQNALDAIFGDTTDVILQRMDTEWQNASAEHWRQSHDSWAADIARLQVLASQGHLESEALSERARLHEQINGPQAALEDAKTLRDRHSDSSELNFHYGRLLLLSGEDASAAEPLTTAVSLDVTWYGDVENLLTWHEQKKGRQTLCATELLAQYRQPWEEVCRIANEERETVSVNDDFRQANLTAEECEHVTKVLAEKPELYAVWLLNKPVVHFPRDPVHLVVVDLDYFHDNVNANEDTYLANLRDELMQYLPGLGTVFVTSIKKHNNWHQPTEGIAPVYRSPAKRRTWWQRGLIGLAKRLGRIAAVLVGVVVLVLLLGDG